eukprot:CAMPEP_0196820976 /NCGR_PEP_ID=MMETSP1362-20130617/77315_1 /TAXON_ID=163516 /ORGANISM="Leptocylindrus danicus, Strain CCMP1856" /LENGTH=647 /DNA_ID=CAMNT_0042200021 /DNA_START=40 /DNA_END=1983 /DNA_ORIENTATION=-
MGLSHSTNLIEAPQDRNDGALASIAAPNDAAVEGSSASPISGGKGSSSSSSCGYPPMDSGIDVVEEHDEITSTYKQPVALSCYAASKSAMKKSCSSAGSAFDMIEDELEACEDDENPTVESNVGFEMYNRRFHVVTTACLPWFTGTAVNPLLRAAYLLKKSREMYAECKNYDKSAIISNVTLVVPWLEEENERLKVYGSGRRFECPADQEVFVRQWLAQTAGLPDEADAEHGLKIMFYNSRYHSGLGSIFAMGDICSLIPDEDADVCVLEEPEHLNWYKAPSNDNWPTKFCHVVGIIHTNYKAYAWSTMTGIVTAPAIELMSKLMAGYCHKIVKLSPVLQEFSPEKDVTSNVHGVRSEFLDEGIRRKEATLSQSGNAISCGKVYFIGKLLWAKGLDLLLNMEEVYRTVTGDYFEIDIFGTGPDEKEIIRAFHGRKKKNKNDMKRSQSDGSLAKKRKVVFPKSLHELRGNPIPANFKGRVDHALCKGEYKVFVNPSITEVLCTTTAEALAMGKFAIIPAHPSNTFFSQFPNCLMYSDKLEFVANMRHALTHEPVPLTAELHRQFTWEAATERFVDASIITKRNARKREIIGKAKLDERFAKIHNMLADGTKGDVLRHILGGGPVIGYQVKYMKERSRNTSCPSLVEIA